jgi:hypothetical protein
MLSKIAAVAHSKVALAVLGAVLVGGGGGAVAMAATTGHLSTLGVNAAMNSSSASSNSHAHTTSVEGLLTACSATTTPATISVKDGSGKSWTFVVSATTKINGDTHTDASHGASSASNTTGAGASSAKGDNSTHAGDNTSTGTGASSAKGDNSANAGDSSAHTATLADVCTSANIGTRDVQVQATKNGASYDAWKVTLHGAGSASGDSSDGHASDGGSSGSSSDAASN